MKNHEQGRTTLDAAARKPIYQQAQKLFIDDAALCVTYAPTMVALSSRNVHNLPFAPVTGVRLSQVWKTG